MSKEHRTSKLVVMLKPSERARLDQKAEQLGLELSSLVRLKTLGSEDRVQPPQHEAA
jgi:hypothetical protein